MNVGDTVVLKSGFGPRMTISRTALDLDRPTVDCMWFDVDQTLCSATFPVAALRKCQGREE